MPCQMLHVSVELSVTPKAFKKEEGRKGRRNYAYKFEVKEFPRWREKGQKEENS